MPRESHSYEEVRDAGVALLIGDAWSSRRPKQFNDLIVGVAEYFDGNGRPVPQHRFAALNAQDEEYVRDVFWDLFRLGYITLGMNNSNTEFPWFRLSYRGQGQLASSDPWKFHDTESFFALLVSAGVVLSNNTDTYLEEALQAFYAQCPLAACVMLGVAAEAEFDAFLAQAAAHPVVGEKFERICAEKFVATRVRKFRATLGELKNHVGQEVLADVETHLDAIQSIIRIARNETGHPTGTKPTREQVYVYLQLFIPFAKKLGEVRDAVGRIADAPMVGQ